MSAKTRACPYFTCSANISATDQSDCQPRPGLPLLCILTRRNRREKNTSSTSGSFLKLVKEASPVPYVVGFGISSYEQVEEMGRHADGVVIGSAIVEQIGLRCEALKQAESRDEAVKEIEQYVNSLLHPAPTY